MNILYAISTKSNLERKTFCVKIAVDLFVRSWVEISTVHAHAHMPFGRPLREVVSWNKREQVMHDEAIVDLFVRSWVEIQLWQKNRSERNTSTSSWGRELKLTHTALSVHGRWVDLFVRSWVEIQSYKVRFETTYSRPLREVVSWNVLNENDMFFHPTVDLFVRSWVEIW